MLICFFDSQAVVHKEFVPQRQTVNKQYCREILERLRKRVHCVRPETADTWMLHHDNGPCHTAISVRKLLTKNGIPVVQHPPYSPDLSPCDFFSRNSNFTSKIVILELWTTSKISWQTSWGNFHMKNSSIATGSGSIVSGGMWLPKGIMLIYSSVVNNKFYSTSLITF